MPLAYQASFNRIHCTITGTWTTANGTPRTRFLRCTCGWRLTGITGPTRGRDEKLAYSQFDAHKKEPGR